MLGNGLDWDVRKRSRRTGVNLALKNPSPVMVLTTGCTSIILLFPWQKFIIEVGANGASLTRKTEH